MPQPTSKARLVITALFVDHQTPAEVVRVVNAITGELLRELTVDTNKDYQPRTQK